MATKRASRSGMVFLVFLIACIGSGASEKSYPRLDDVLLWARVFGETIKMEVATLTGFDILNLNYKDKGSGAEVQVNMDNEVKASELVKTMSTRLAEMLGKKMGALRQLVIKAEEAAKRYQWMDNLEKKEVEYYNSRDMTGVDMEVSERFDKELTFNASSVHIPIEIYDGDIEILNGLKWTAELDRSFKENYEKDPDILWQYFGSQTGFMRSYPGSPWVTRGEVDLYDVRRQSWYTQGSSSPKDMLILIDTSGSTHGQSLQLMKVAVKSILDTLGENDFVNIVAFAQTANFVSECFNETTFVQANYRNKKRLAQDVDELKAQGQADFKAGLTFAFEQFLYFERNNSEKGMGAGCNKVIMLLTDGGTDNAESVFQKFNWAPSFNKSVRVFTIGVGPTKNPHESAKWMACRNRGYFSQIPAMGAIRARVQEHKRFLMKPWGYHGPSNENWEVTHDPRGLGLMTTVTLPVYNRTSGTSNQTILGVMGIDVTTAEMVKMSPFTKIGPNGYAFAINPNGYIIFHPNLKAGQSYLKDPPSIDLLEVEVESDSMVELRRRMILQDEGLEQIRAQVVTPDMRHLYEDDVTYAFTPIKNTSFSLGISVPSYQKHYPTFTGSVKALKPKYLQSDDKIALLIAPWEYYANMSRQTDRTGTGDDIISKLNSDNVDWDEQLLFHLYWDSEVLYTIIRPYFLSSLGTRAVNDTTNSTDSSNSTSGGDMLSEWTDNSTSSLFALSDLLSDGHLKDGIVNHFVATSGGLTLVVPASQNVSFFDERDVRTANYFKRAMYTKKFMFMAPYHDGPRKNTSKIPDIMIARSIEMTGKVYKPAVTGMTVTHQQLLKQLVSVSVNHSLTTAGDISNRIYHCNDMDRVYCYLLDDGGFIIAVNQEEHFRDVGRFLGQVDPELMNLLFNRSMYERHEDLDYQAVCIDEKPVESAGPSNFRIPSMNLVFEALTSSWWTTKVAWTYINYNLYNWLFGSNENYAFAEEGDEEVHNCIKKLFEYYYGRATQLDEDIICADKERKVKAIRVEYDTNLLLVVTDPPLSDCGETELLQAPIKISEDDEKEVICELAKRPRFRRQPGDCYDRDPNEDETECAGSSLSPSILVLLSASVAAMMGMGLPWLRR